MAGQNPRDMRDWMRTLERKTSQQRPMAAIISEAIDDVERERETEKARRPAPPVEIEAQTAYYDHLDLRRKRVRVSIDFPDVIFNTDGTKATIQQYELWGYQVVTRDENDYSEPAWIRQVVSPTSTFRAEDYVPGHRWTFRIRAIGIDAVQPGEWSEEFTVQMAKDSTPPPQPTPPALESSRGQLILTWDGKAVSGDMPADFSYAILAHGTSANPTKEFARFGIDGGIAVYTGAKYGVPQHFRIRAVDESGQMGPWSEQVTGVTKPLVDMDIIISELDAAETQIKNAGKIMIESGIELGQKLKQHADLMESTERKLTGPGGLTERLEDAETLLDDAGSLMFTTGQTLRQKLSATDAELEAARKRLATTETNVAAAAGQITAAEQLIASNNTALTNKLTAANTAIGNAQSQVDTLRTITLPALNSSLTAATGRLTAAEGKLATAEGKITAAETGLSTLSGRVSPLETGINTLRDVTIPAINLSINGKTTIVRSGSIASLPANYSLGDRWEKWSSLGIGGKLQQTWRHNGSAWVEEILDASYLPLVDIGAGTFGSLTGGRLTVGSVSADRLVIGMGENLLADPSFEDPIISARRAGSNANWSWVQNPLTGSYMTATADSGDMQLGNSSNAELFPIDPKGALAFTAEFEGPDLQVYLQVKYADGTLNTGPYLQTLTSATKGTGKRTATVQWDFNGASLSSTGSPPVSARPILRARPGGTQKVYSVRLAPATKGELIVNGTITGDHVAADSVAAKVGQFIQLDVSQLTVTGTANIRTVVAQSIAGATAEFQRVDAKNLFVTGNTSLNEATAKRLAAETGTFLSLRVDQLDVPGNANFKQAVADKMFANMFAANKISTNELIVGKGENLIPWLVNNDVGSRTTEPHTAVNGGSVLNLDASGTGLIGNHALTNNQNVVPGTYLNVIQLRPGHKANNLPAGVFEVLPNQKYILSVWVRAGGTYGTYPSIRFNVGLYDGAGAYANGPWYSPNPTLLNWNWQEIRYEFTTNATHSGAAIWIQANQPGVVRIDQPMLVKDAASLIATGGIVADHITASEAMSAKVGQFLKLSVGDLTSTGTTKLNEAVAKTLFSEIFATNKLTAQQAYIGGSNLFGATMDDPGWAGGTPSATGGRNDDPSLLISGSTAEQVGAYFGLAEAAQRAKAPRLVPGQTYRALAWVRGSASIPKGKAAIYMRLYAESGGSYVWASPSKVSNEAVIPANTWGKVEGFFTVPEGNAVVAVPGVYSEKDAGALRFSGFALQDAATPDLIVENGILARHITASEEMSAKIGTFLKLDVGNLTATGTSNLNEAVIENLWAKVVRSRAITTDMLMVGKGANLIPNGDLSLGREGWTGSWGLNANDSLAKAHGYTSSIWYLGNGTGNGPTIPVKANTKYQFSLLARANTAGKRFYVQFMTDNADATNPYLVSNQLTYTDYRAYTGEIEIPAGVTQGYLRIYANHTNGSTTEGHQWFTGFEMYEKNAASLIVDGAIVTKQLKVTSDMTAALLKAKKVEAGEIDVNSLAADSAFIGFLRTHFLYSDVFQGKVFSGGTFTGTVFQTTTSNNRGVQIDGTNGLRAWNSSGTQTFGVTTAGAVSATGSFSATASNISASLTTQTMGSFSRPMLAFRTPNHPTNGYSPMIFAEGAGTAAGSYGEGSLVMMGSEQTANTSGRSELVLRKNGEGGHLQTIRGANGFTGLRWAQDDVYLMGKMGQGYANSTLRGGRSAAFLLQAGYGTNITYAHTAPSINGRVRPIITVNHETDWGTVSVNVHSVFEGSFVCRVINTSTQALTIAGVYWMGWLGDL